MTSIYQDALGDDFARLHPRLQHRFGFSSADNTCQIGTGTMDQVWRGPFWTLPFLFLGSTRRVLFPSRGSNIPFTISNYAYIDQFGRETVTWSRRFKMKNRIRAFDATMIHSAKRGAVIDYLGTHQHLAVDIRCSVDEDGAMCIHTGDMRFYERFVGFSFPMLFAGHAAVRESWDEPSQQFKIDVNVKNRVFGPLFGYHGSFTVTERPCTVTEIPLDVLPVRQEWRE
jgi:Domain of unknown function (DUF4166)